MLQSRLLHYMILYMLQTLHTTVTLTQKASTFYNNQNKE